MNEQELLFEKLSCETNSGYWKVDGKCFLSKIECLQYATKIKNHKVSYHLFDSVYNSLDWSAEPKHSLDELYRLRALQIREKYDYVMIAFSGGSDSSTVVDSFLDNNIPVEEIVCYYPLKATEKLRPGFNINDRRLGNVIFEYELAAKPKLEWIAKHRPEIKITIIDTSERIEELVLAENLHEMVECGISLTVYNSGRVHISNMLKQYSEKHHACVVFGIDKPNLRYDPVSKRLGVCISDFSHKQCKVTVDGYQPIVEPFYSSPNMPEILHAQGKALSKVLVPFLESKQNVDKLSKPSLYKNPFVILDQNSNIVKTTLYSKWDVNIWQTEGKQIRQFGNQHEYDWWFHATDFYDKRTKDFFAGQHHEWLTDVDPHFFRKDDDGTPFAFIPYVSKIYWC